MRRAISQLALVTLAVASVSCSSQPTPAGPKSQVAFGVEMARQGLWEEAMFRFRQASERDPNNFEIIANMAVAAEALGQFEEAERLYRRALSLNAGNKDLRYNHDRFLGFWEAYQMERAADAASAPEDGATDEGDGDAG